METHVHKAVAPMVPSDDAALRKKHARALKIVFAINAVMAVVEATTGLMARSTALVADMLDMGGDALNAGAGLLVNSRSKKWQAGAALGKAAFMGIFGLGVLAQAGLRLFSPVTPVALTMGIVGGAALVANAVCYKILHRYRNDNLNIKSTLACTRNDMASNIGTILAAGVSFFVASALPDLIVGATVSALCLKSAVSIGRQAIAQLRGKNLEAPAADCCAHKPSRFAPSKLASKLKKTLTGPFNRKAAAPKAEAAEVAPPPVLSAAADRRSPVTLHQ